MFWWKSAKIFMSFSKPQVSSSVLWKITPLWFLRSKVIYFARKRPIKIHRILVIFETKWFFFQILHHSSVSWDVTLRYFLAEILYTINKRNLSSYKFGEIKSLKFDSLMGSFCQNDIKLLFSTKKYRRAISHDTEEWWKL